MLNEKTTKAIVVKGRTLPKGWTLAWADYRQVGEEEYEFLAAILNRRGIIDSYVWLPYGYFGAYCEQALPTLNEALRGEGYLWAAVGLRSPQEGALR